MSRNKFSSTTKPRRLEWARRAWGRLNKEQAHARKWDCHVITLDPGGHRFRSFTENNKHLETTLFQGVNGQTINDKNKIESGLCTIDLVESKLQTEGMAGCSASHRKLWEQISRTKRGALILEDDCITHARITELINNNFKTLMESDITFFSVNTNSILSSISQSGILTTSLFEPQHPSEDWIKSALMKTDINKIVPHKMIKGFGFCCYFITPKGADKLEQKIFPLSLRTTDVPLVSDQMPAIGIDRAGCGIYKEINALIMLPFSAFTPNIESTIHNK